MTESRHSEMFAAMAAFRFSMIEIAGRLAMLAARLSAPLTPETLRAWQAERAEVSSALGDCARSLGSGVDVLARTADGAMEDTQPIDLRSS